MRSRSHVGPPMAAVAAVMGGLDTGRLIDGDRCSVTALGGAEGAIDGQAVHDGNDVVTAAGPAGQVHRQGPLAAGGSSVEKQCESTGHLSILPRSFQQLIHGASIPRQRGFDPRARPGWAKKRRR